MFRYRLQQRVLSSDCVIPFLTPHLGDEEPQIAFRLLSRGNAPAPRETPWFRSEIATAEGHPSLVIDRDDEGDAIVRFADGTAFHVQSAGRSIAVLTAPDHYTDGDLAAYALGPVLGIALHLQGAVLLHASAVVMRAKAVVFAGDSGSGKSTTAAILHRQGYPVISDDITELDSGGAIASLPALRLWPDVVRALYGDETAFPDRAPSWDKKLIAFDAAETESRPIAAILFLDATRGPAPRLEPLTQKEGWLRLMANVYAARLPGREMAIKVFKVTTSLAARIPMFAFSPPAIPSSDGLGAFLESALREELR